jgi:hypothetical protein
MDKPTPSSFVGITKLAEVLGLAPAHVRSIRFELPHLKRGRRLLFDIEQSRAHLRDKAAAAATPARMTVTNLAPDPHAATRCVIIKQSGDQCKNEAISRDDQGRPVCPAHLPGTKAYRNIQTQRETRQRILARDNGGVL